MRHPSRNRSGAHRGAPSSDPPQSSNRVFYAGGGNFRRGTRALSGSFTRAGQAWFRGALVGANVLRESDGILLLEGSRTNLTQFSTQGVQSHAKTANAGFTNTTGFTGANDGLRSTLPAVADFVIISNSSGITGSVASRTFSIRTWLKATVGSNPTNAINLYTTDNSVGSGTAGSLLFSPPADWSLRMMTTTYSASASGNLLSLVNKPAGSAVNTVIDTWGWQIEEAPFPSSYIPTNGTVATRAADVFNADAVAAQGIVAPNRPFTIRVAVWCQGHAAARNLDFRVDANNAIRLQVSGSGRIQGMVIEGGAVKGLTTSTVLPAQTWVVVALQYDGTRFRIFLNGNLDVTGDVFATSISTPNKLEFFSVSNFFGFVAPGCTPRGIPFLEAGVRSTAEETAINTQWQAYLSQFNVAGWY